MFSRITLLEANARGTRYSTNSLVYAARTGKYSTVGYAAIGDVKAVTARLVVAHFVYEKLRSITSGTKAIRRQKDLTGTGKILSHNRIEA